MMKSLFPTFKCMPTSGPSAGDLPAPGARCARISRPPCSVASPWACGRRAGLFSRMRLPALSLPHPCLCTILSTLRALGGAGGSAPLGCEVVTGQTTRRCNSTDSAHLSQASRAPECCATGIPSPRASPATLSSAMPPIPPASPSSVGSPLTARSASLSCDENTPRSPLAPAACLNRRTALSLVPGRPRGPLRHDGVRHDQVAPPPKLESLQRGACHHRPTGCPPNVPWTELMLFPPLTVTLQDARQIQGC